MRHGPHLAAGAGTGSLDSNFSRLLGGTAGAETASCAEIFNFLRCRLRKRTIEAAFKGYNGLWCLGAQLAARCVNLSTFSFIVLWCVCYMYPVLESCKDGLVNLPLHSL
jgi:hypothetical protein